MSFLGFKVCLASDSRGLVTENGVPLEGAKVTRNVNNKGEHFEDETTTDASGRFSFPAIYDRSLWKHMPVEPIISQEVIVTYKGKSHTAWDLTKGNLDYNGELNSDIARKNNTAIPFDVTCELNDEERARQLPESMQLIYGKCITAGEPPAN